ncbi:MAG: hypothetical protein DUD39_11675 [Coriobacteriaceae bacterium]|nr:MAG: hypothetical protein DUD39_11675 [Coriobacteriaceae bacterium]
MYLLQIMFALLRRGNLKMLSWIPGPHGASVHLDLMSEQVPDTTTSAKMCHSLKARGVRQSYASRLNLELKKAGITARGGSMVDATFIEAPSSTKNKDHARNP